QTARAQIPNNYIRAVRQINGSLTDASGTLVPKEATPGPNPDGSYITPNANFERDAAIFDVVDVTGMYLWSFGGDLFPGIPGSGGHTTKFALEAVTFLELPAGPTT